LEWLALLPARFPRFGCLAAIAGLVRPADLPFPFFAVFWPVLMPPLFPAAILAWN